MIVKGIIDEDFVNYKKASTVILCPKCSFKCDKECGQPVCQNSELTTQPDIDVPIETLGRRYLDNPITSAIVFAGLEPFDSYFDVMGLSLWLRSHGCKDDIVLYTGYTEAEIDQSGHLPEMCEYITPFVIKFGRYIPNHDPHHDEVLGVDLASNNQYAKRYESENEDN